MSDFAEVKRLLNIVDYISKTVPLKKAGQYFKACCPFHAERTPSFVVNEANQSWRCYGACADGGDVFTFAMKQNGWSHLEALSELAKIAGYELTAQTPEKKERAAQDERIRGLLVSARDYYQDQLFHSQAAQTYLKQRGLTAETVNLFELGYVPAGWSNLLKHLTTLGYQRDDLEASGLFSPKETTNGLFDRFRARLMFPIHDEKGRIVGFGGRSMDGSEPKYVNSEGGANSPFHKSRILYGLHLASRAIKGTETAVIVEGYMDVIQAHQAGFTNVVGQMGTAITEQQLKLIAPRQAKKIILALDSDAAGQTATLRGLEVARQTLQADYTGKLSVDLRILSIPGAKDPDDLIRENAAAWGELVEASRSVADYVIEVETANLPANASVPERKAIAEKLIPLLVATSDNLYRREGLQQLALRLRFNENDIFTLAEQMSQKRPQNALNQTTGPIPPRARENAADPLIRGLLTGFNVLYGAINLKFTELAESSEKVGDEQLLLAGPLRPLDAEDVGEIYAPLLDLIFEANGESEVGTLAYVRDRAPEALVQVIDQLVSDEADLKRVPFAADLTSRDEWKYRPAAEESEVVKEAINLRIASIKRAQEELTTLLAEDEEGVYLRQFVILSNGRALLEAAARS